MKKLIYLFAILAMAFTIQSCDSDGDSGTQVVTIDGYSRVQTFGDNSVSNKKAHYEVGTNLSKMKMTLKATCAIEGSEDVTLLFKDVDLTFAPGTGLLFSTASITPMASNGKEYTVTDFHGVISSYPVKPADATDATIINLFQVSYTVNGKYAVASTAHTTGSNVPQLLYANCSTTTTADGIAPFTSSATMYRIDMTTATEANVTIMAAQFAEKMPLLTIVLPKVSVTTTGDGYILKADELTPTINGTPMPAYKIHNFRMTSAGNCMTASVAFSCGINGLSYSVSASCQLVPEIKIDQDSDSDSDSDSDQNSSSTTFPEQ